MFDYLQQFNNLPASLREKVSSPEAMSSLNSLEAKYKLDLATVVMRLMVKNIPFSQLSKFLSSENNMRQEEAEALASDLAKQVLSGVNDYLGISSGKTDDDFFKQVDTIIKQAGVTFPSTETIKRFRQAILTYLKGVRSKIDLRAILSRPADLGGFGLNPSQTDQVISLAATVSLPDKAIKGEVSKPVTSLQKIIDSEASKVLSKAVSDNYDLKAAILSRQNDKQKTDKVEQKKEDEKEAEVKAVSVSAPILPLATSKILLEESLSPLPMVVEKKQIIARPGKPVPEKVEKKGEAKLEEVKIKPVEIKKPELVKSPEKTSVAKPIAPAGLREPGSDRRIQDIKPAPRVISPIDELKMLSVTNFRRLGASSPARIEKIISKIKLLEKDGYDKMVQGVKAWRVSPANRLYLQIAKDALVGGMTIKAAAEERGKQNKETYSMEEVEAIINLNNRLMF